MAEEKHTKLKHPNCPQCGEPMRIIVPINMAVCDKCGEKYYIERMGDEFIVLGKYYEVKAKKVREETENKPEPEETEEPPVEETPEPEEATESEVEAETSEEPEPEEKPEEEKAQEVPTEPEEALKEIMPPIIDNKQLEFKQLVEKYVTRKFWVQVAKEELKNMVSELYDAGALGNKFNPSRVAKILLSMPENATLPFYGIDWLDKAVTQELLTRIWLKLQGYKEVMKIEKLKYYIALFHPEDIQKFVNGELEEIKVKKYLYEMEAIEE